MISVDYRTLIEHGADRVWRAIRCFDRYEWAGDVRNVQMENGEHGNSIGAVRSFAIGDARFRHKLVAHSDGDRSYTYSSCEPSPIADFRATLHVFPARIAHVALGNRSWVEWRAVSNCDEADRPRWAALLSHSFARSLESLKWYLSRETDASRPVPLVPFIKRSTPWSTTETEFDGLKTEGAFGTADIDELARRRFENDRRYWDPGYAKSKSEAVPQRDVASRPEGAPQHDPEWLWSTIRNAARGG
jgi:Polyketide cyclase / dehydrase and lipid transport